MEISLPALLTIIFVILKLTGAIAWSWWWVLSPLWICFGLYIVYGLVLFIAYLIVGNSVKRYLTRRFR